MDLRHARHACSVLRLQWHEWSCPLQLLHAQLYQAHVRDAVRSALGHTGAVEAGAAGTFARDVVGALAAELLPGLKDL